MLLSLTQTYFENLFLIFTTLIGIHLLTEETSYSRFLFKTFPKQYIEQCTISE